MMTGVVCCFKQKTAYEMRISDWSSDVGSSDLVCDISTASMSSLTIARALFHRLRTGEGERTWDTLLGTATYLQSAEIIRFEGRPPAIVGDRKSTRLNSSH